MVPIEFNEKAKKVIADTTKEIMAAKDYNKNGTLELKDFVNYYNEKDIFEARVGNILITNIFKYTHIRIIT